MKRVKLNLFLILLSVSIAAYAIEFEVIDDLVVDGDNSASGVNIGTTTNLEKLTVTGRISVTGSPNSADDVGDRGYNDARYLGITATAYDSTRLNGQLASYYMTAATDNWVNTTGDTMTGPLTLSGTSANILLGSNYLSGDGGDEGVFVAADGNVGIGEAVPDAKLEVSGTFAGYGIHINSTSGAGLEVDRGALANAGGVYYQTANANNWWTGMYQDNNFHIKEDGLGYSGTSRLTVQDSTGYVGIGDTTPENKIDITTALTATNVTTGISLDGRIALSAASDNTWLRLNQSSDFSSGIYTPTHFRSDGEIRQGSGDAGGFEIQTGGQMYVADYGVFMGGVHVGGTSNPETDNLVVDGNVAIGTTTAGSKLVVAGTEAEVGVFASATDHEGLRLQTDYVNGNTNSRVFFAENSAYSYGFSLLYAGNNSNVENFSGATGMTYTGNRFHILRHDNSAVGAAAMTIMRSNGNVGIGTTSPSASLEVNGWIGRSAHNNGALLGGYNNIGANSAQTNPIFTIGSSYLPAATTLGNMYGIGYAHTNASYITDPGPNTWGMYVAADGDARIWLGASSGGDSYFNSGGNVGVGTNNPNYKLQVNGTAAIQALQFTSTVTGTSSPTYYFCLDGSPPGAVKTISSSSRRYKENIHDWNQDALSLLLQLRPVTFDYREDYIKENRKDQIGFIAEEVEMVYPYGVMYKKEGSKRIVENVNYFRLPVLLVKAMQELNREIDELEAVKDKEIKELKTIICSGHPEADVCR